MLKGNLISAEDYRVFRSETYNEISNFVSEDQRVERIKAELDRIVDLPWDFAGKQIATRAITG